MILGDLLADLDDEATAMETLLGLGDLALLARVEEAAAADDLSAGAFTVQSVRAFSARASDAEWVSLLGALGRSADPGQACLKQMVAFALRPPVAHRCADGVAG